MSKMPPVPPANKSPKGPGSDPKVKSKEQKPAATGSASKNLAEQDQQGNIKQNTTNQGRLKNR
jgi:hypothetical protein